MDVCESRRSRAFEQQCRAALEASGAMAKEILKNKMEQTNRQKTLKAVLHYFYQDNTTSGSHCRYNLKYHLVWITKYPRSFLVGEIAERLLEILAEIAQNYRFEIIAMQALARFNIRVTVPSPHPHSKQVLH